MYSSSIISSNPKIALVVTQTSFYWSLVSSECVQSTSSQTMQLPKQYTYSKTKLSTCDSQKVIWLHHYKTAWKFHCSLEPPNWKVLFIICLEGHGQETCVLIHTNSYFRTQHYSSLSIWQQCHNQLGDELPLYTARLKLKSF